MSIVVFLFTALVVSSYANYCQAPLPKMVHVPPDFKIVFVQTLARHGDRSPMNSFDGDNAYYNCSSESSSSLRLGDEFGTATNTQKVNVVDKKRNIFAQKHFWSGNCEVTQLTSKGIQQHHELGKAQREKYLKMGLIPSTYDDSKIYIRSTEKSRTIQSSQAFTQTFYPTSTRSNNEAIPIHVTPIEIEVMRPNRNLCKAIGKKESDVYKNFAIINETRSAIKEVEEKAIRVLGFRSKYQWLEDYIDILNCRICSGIELPCRNGECLTRDDFDVLWYQTQLENRYLYRNDGLAQLQNGFFLRELIESADMVFNGTSSHVYEHYTGHDSTLIPFLSLIGQDVFIWPPYASHIDIEHYMKGNEKYVRVVYNNGVLQLPFCEQQNGFCKWNEYRKYMFEHNIPTLSNCKLY
ncbi:Lysophosphatidic acid phosphatase type 6 [Entamoeba marina]